MNKVLFDAQRTTNIFRVKIQKAVPVSLKVHSISLSKMSFERYISDFGHFESALRDYGVENIQNVLVMNDQDIMIPLFNFYHKSLFSMIFSNTL